MKSLPLGSIQFDADTQMRDGLNGDTVADYRDAMKGGAEFPPLVVFFDGSAYWLGDGYHRWHAAREADLASFACDVRQGSKRDAILHAVGANSGHGLRRTNADKHKAVKTLLTDAEWVTWSDHVIAEKCGVSHPFVGKLRESLVTVTSRPVKRKGKDGRACKPKTTSATKSTPAKPPRHLVDDDSEPDGDEDEQDDTPEIPARIEPPQSSGNVISRFRPFWDKLTSQEQTTLFVWINDQLK
jgi:hypothetical protein